MAQPGQRLGGYQRGRTVGANQSSRGMVDASQYQQVRAAARRFSRELDKELKDGLKAAADIGTDAVKRKLDMIPVQGGTQANRNRRGSLNRGSLRKTLQAGTKTQVRNKDVRIIQSPRGISGKNARGLPRRLNQDGPFQHPVFGHADRQVSQRSWRHFTSVIVPKFPEMTREILGALNRALDRIAEGGG